MSPPTRDGVRSVNGQGRMPLTQAAFARCVEILGDHLNVAVNTDDRALIDPSLDRLKARLVEAGRELEATFGPGSRRALVDAWELLDRVFRSPKRDAIVASVCRRHGIPLDLVAGGASA